MVMPVANHAAVRTPFDKANRPMMRNEPGGGQVNFQPPLAVGGHFFGTRSSLEDQGLSHEKTMVINLNLNRSDFVIHICQTTMIHCDFFIILPIPSMYGIFTYICHKNQLNVGKYTIHGSHGLYIYISNSMVIFRHHLWMFPLV